MTDGLKSIIAQLERQNAVIGRALAALREVDGGAISHEAASSPATRKGGMTPEGRKRLIEALKRRWAARRAAATKEAPTSRKSNFTPEGRKRLAEAMKRRWAVKRAASAVEKRAARPKRAA